MFYNRKFEHSIRFRRELGCFIIERTCKLIHVMRLLRRLFALLLNTSCSLASWHEFFYTNYWKSLRSLKYLNSNRHNRATTPNWTMVRRDSMFSRTVQYRWSMIQSYSITCQKIGKSWQSEITQFISQMMKPKFSLYFSLVRTSQFFDTWLSNSYLYSIDIRQSASADSQKHTKCRNHGISPKHD